jgi:molybdate transport system substrate-binding protein
MMQIAVVSTPALAPVLRPLAREFERMSSHVVVVSYATAGAMRAAVTDALADVAISTSCAVDDLESNGHVVADGRRDIARVGLGVQIARGAPKRDVTTVEALRAALLDVRTIGYIDPASGAAAGAHAVRVMCGLGIADAVAGRTKLAGGAALIDAVATGEIELGLAPISEILSDARVVLVGPVPEPLQEVTILVAAITNVTPAPAAARAFVDFLASGAAQSELAKAGLR